MPKHDPNFAKFRDTCRSYGLAVTVQRFLVYRALAASKEHPTADTVYENLHPEFPHLSRMSVYRILESFALSGMIRRVSHPGAVTRYDAFLFPHHHVVCVVCGQVVDIPSEEDDLPFLTERLPARLPEGFQVIQCTADIQGVCRECSEKNS